MENDDHSYTFPSHPSHPQLALPSDACDCHEAALVRSGMGKAYLAQPGLRAESNRDLRSAFIESMRDAAYVAEKQKQKFHSRTVAGSDAWKTVEDVAATNPESSLKIQGALEANPNNQCEA